MLSARQEAHLRLLSFLLYRSSPHSVATFPIMVIRRFSPSSLLPPPCLPALCINNTFAGFSLISFKTFETLGLIFLFGSAPPLSHDPQYSAVLRLQWRDWGESKPEAPPAFSQITHMSDPPPNLSHRFSLRLFVSRRQRPIQLLQHKCLRTQNASFEHTHLK